MTSDFSLYRESLGKYLFEGRPEIYFNARLTPTERALLEVHEHDHWSRANATIFGREQLSLAWAVRFKAGQPAAEELERCLQVTVEFSRLVYEGSALAAERVSSSVAGSGASMAWASLLETEVYGEANALFDRWLSRLPYAPGVLSSIAANATELCLNSVSVLDDTKSDRDPISARDPMTLHAEDVRALLVARSPDSLLRRLSEQLVAGTSAFVQRLDTAVDETFGPDGLTAGALRASDALAGIGPMTEGMLIYAIYKALRGFAEDRGAIDATEEYGLLQTIFEHRQADWLRKLLAGDRAGTPMAPGIAVGPPSEEQVSSELEFFAKIYTVVRPPERDRSTDLPIGSWDPVHEAFRAFDPQRRKLYLAITAQPPASEGASPSERWYMLSAARAVIAPHDGFIWKFGRSRYVLEVPASRLRASVEEIFPYNPAIAIPFDLMEFEAGGIRDVGPLPETTTLGILLGDVPLERWAEEIEHLSWSFRTMSHYYEIGPAEAPFVVTFGIVGTARWFLYTPLSLSMRRMINEDFVSITDIPGHEAAWTLDEIPMTQRFQMASFLICEQYMVNGR